MDLNIKLETLSLNSTSNVEHIVDNRSREQILADRKVRRNEKKNTLRLQKQQDMINSIRAPKSEKITIIKESVLLAYKQSDNAPSPNKKKTKRREVNFVDILKVQIENPMQPKTIANTNTKKDKHQDPTVIVRNKGKKREIPAKKYIHPLKRNILLSRQLRKTNIAINCESESVNKSIDEATVDDYVSISANKKIAENDEITLKHTQILLKSMFPTKTTTQQLSPDISPVRHNRHFRP